MTRTEELLAACNAEFERGKAAEVHLGYTGDMAGNYVVDMRNKDLKQLIALVRLQHEALATIADEENWSSGGTWESSRYPDEIAMDTLEAFNKFERGE